MAEQPVSRAGVALVIGIWLLVAGVGAWLLGLRLPTATRD
jgi:hypothetical protein